MEKNLKKFKNLFLGRSANSKKCAILNPEILSFEIDSETGDYIAYADSIIRVENQALGYRIHIILKMFSWKPAEENIQYLIYPRFEILAPQNIKQLTKWLKNRQETYNGSLRHFLRSLACGNLYEQKFEVYSARKTGFFRTARIRFSSESYKKELLSPDITGLKRFHHKQWLNIIYKKRKQTWLEIKRDFVLIDTLGNCYNPFSIRTWGYWSEARLADMLPADYMPDN